MRYRVTKTYGHELGLSAAFRQWRAESHCRFIHGYALSFEFEFTADELDENNWVIDFGSLKPIKEWLQDMFDHKLLAAENDPELPTFRKLHAEGIVDLRVVEKTGCEAFAKRAWEHVNYWLESNQPRVRLLRVTVREHGANAASYFEVL